LLKQFQLCAWSRSDKLKNGGPPQTPGESLQVIEKKPRADIFAG
jgi:hypothetical protein